jgi:Na+/H+ antiporter NhaC
MSWLSLIPPVLAITLAIWKREVVLALLVAVFSAEVLLADFNPLRSLLQTIERITAVFSSPDNTRILLFSILVGALLALIRTSGGVDAFVRWLLNAGLARGPRSVAMLTSLLGVVIFIETYLSMLACGTFAQSLFDRYRMSRARLAFIVDSTSSPVSVLILLNGWGAYVLGLLQGYGLENPVATMLASIPLNFYALSVLILVFYTAWTCRVHGAMAQHEREQALVVPPDTEAPRGKARYFVLPLLSLIVGIVGFMFYTGNGALIDGSGAASVLYAVCVALLLVWLLLRIDGISTHAELVRTSFAGMAELLPIVGILVLAFALGNSLQELQTGLYLASMISDTLPLWLIAPAVFLCACCISFTTGTSWGTFAILIPVAIPIALATGVSPALLLAAVLGGGVFGDHCSPISDSTILSSLASGCDLLTHVRTQLPYALAAGAASLLLFTLAGL